MSTDHEGDYCPVKDKRMLTRQKAQFEAGRMGMTSYECEHCGMWHTTHRNKGLRRTKQ